MEESINKRNIIDSLRVILIFGVVSIHIYAFGDKTDGLYFYHERFLHIFECVCVPLFFFLAGYFFFYKKEYSDEMFYLSWKKRLSSLLIPYILWNLLFLLLTIPANKIGLISFAYPSKFYDWINLFGWGVDGVPVDGPLWFIRDLMILTLFTPIIKVMVKTCKPVTLVGGVITLLIIYKVDYAIFVLGCIFALKGIDFVEFCIKNKFIALFFAIVSSLVILSVGELPISFLWKCQLFLHTISFAAIYISILTKIDRKYTLKYIPKFSKAVFFIYASHYMFINESIRRVLYSFMRPQCSYEYISIFYINLLLAIIITYCIYLILSKILPKTISLLTGGRS